MMKNKPFVHQKIFKKIITKKEEFHKMFNYNIKMNPKLLQLNLLAEKSKNKFFNLILNELKNNPKTLNEKMGMQKPKRGYPKSLESLRMHMGINSKIMINTEYNNLNSPNHTKQRSNSRENILINSFTEKISAIIKPVSENKNKNEILNNEINIFREYMKIKMHYKPVLKRQLTSQQPLLSINKNSFSDKKNNSLQPNFGKKILGLLNQQDNHMSELDIELKKTQINFKKICSNFIHFINEIRFCFFR